MKNITVNIAGLIFTLLESVELTGSKNQNGNYNDAIQHIDK